MECWSTPLQWLCKVAGYWQELEHAVIFADPEHPKHGQWVTCPVSIAGHARTGIFSASRNCLQILATWARALSCCNIRWLTWINGTTGIHPWREHLSKVPDAIECEHLPTQVGYDDELQSGRDPDEDDEHADELPWDGFWQFMLKFFGYSNRLFQQLSGWLVSDDLRGEDAGCGCPGLVWLHVVCGCEAGWIYCQILWNAFGDGLW